VAFIFGLLMDVHSGAVLGQHALAYTLLSFFAVTVHRRLLWFSVPSQALQILPLFLAAHAVRCWSASSRAACSRLGAAARARHRGAAVASCHGPAVGAAAKGTGPGSESTPVTELKNTERELSRFRIRLVAAAAVRA
jgi:rod shape-determining protein MreD